MWEEGVMDGNVLLPYHPHWCLILEQCLIPFGGIYVCDRWFSTSSYGAVSYTHLDVYKRQVLEQIINERKLTNKGVLSRVFWFHAKTKQGTKQNKC